MKTYIDLLPESKREEIQKEKRFRTIIGQEIGLAFPVVLFVVILLVINIVLKIQAEGVETAYQNEQTLTGHQELKVYDDKFKEANTRLDLVSKIQDSHLEWVEVLTKLSQLFPDGVYVNGIATKDYRMFLIGKAQKREYLLKFQESISTSECFANINAPLSNLVSRENIDFQIDFDIKKECLRVR
jgi:Tfp pilus assembly protein PilN